MKRNELGRSEFEDQEEWEKEELEEHPDRASENRAVDNTTFDLMQRARQRSLEKIRQEGVGYSKKPKKLD